MRFHVDRDVFSEAVSFVVKLLPQRTALPILSGVLMEVSSDGLTLSSFDYEVSARTTVVADVEEEGRVLVSGRLLANIASRLPNEVIDLFTENSTVHIHSGSARFTLLSMPVEEFPTIPQVDEQTGVVRADDFGTAVGQIAVAASSDDGTPVLMGVNLEIGENTLRFTATDRYRVASRAIDWENAPTAQQADGRTALVPSRTLAEVGKTLASSGTIAVSLTKKDDRELIAFTGGTKTVTSLLVMGNFPPVHRLFPETIDNYAVLATAELIESVRRVSLVIEKDAALRFTFGDNTLTLESLGSETATASESIDAVLHGHDHVVSLRPQFLIDGLSAVNSEFVRMAFLPTDNPNKPGPVLITGQTSKEEPAPESYKYLLQPNLLLR